MVFTNYTEHPQSYRILLTNVGFQISTALPSCKRLTSIRRFGANMWCVARFWICQYLAFAWSFGRMRMHANALFYVHIVFTVSWVSMAYARVYQMSNIWMPFKRVNTSNIITFECCFLIPYYHKNYNVMSSLTVLRHVRWSTFICSAVQCFH